MAYDENNVFAKILRGELPCKKVYEDEHALAFHDIRPNPRDATIEVYRLWDEIKGSYPAEELIREPYQGRYGIGVITMP